MFKHMIILASLAAPAHATPTIIWNAADMGFSDNLALALAPGGTASIYGPHRFGYSDVSDWYASQAYEVDEQERRFLIGLAEDGQAIDAVWYLAADGESGFVSTGMSGPWAWSDGVVWAPGFVGWEMPEPGMLAGAVVLLMGTRRR